ncbi:hypothetical protein [Pseudarthrobacter sp. NBSH8]|uniref:hypothetical protein n=1 Tax=Pseudarthrobacter sp. NBSH8 TaxID=2596911 RepID=UPI00162AC220|nr:hypothetical protein [Pseudarthrobacter sp. NBSH8]QNE15604.1 hypothetical protein FYJ92_15110 [Pseudarthrobacter sp. NBSH8]
MLKQFRLKGSSLEAIRKKAETRYGAGARIVAAEKVTNPGIAGLFAANRFEATVEVPAEPPAALRAGNPERPTAAAGPVPETHPGLHRPAIAALLEQADATEQRLHAGTGTAVPRSAAVPVSPAVPVSTARADFAGLLEQLGKEYGPVAPAVGRSLPASVPEAGKAPTLLAGAGDLVLLLGLGDDALGPALEMSMAAGGCDVRTGGKLSAFGHLHIPDRQGATAARAGAVATGQTVLLAFGLGRPRDVAGHAALIAGFAADQIWVVADARRKPEDTAAWLGVLTQKLGVDALAVVGTADTLSPGTVNSLGLPVGWQDGRKVH